MRIPRAAQWALLVGMAIIGAGCSSPNRSVEGLSARILSSANSLSPGDYVTLSLKLDVPSSALPAISWSAASGSIAQGQVANEAVYTAGSEEGDFEVSAKAMVGEKAHEARTIIRVRKPGATRDPSAQEFFGVGRLKNREAVKALMFADSSPLYLSPEEPSPLGPVHFKLRLPAGIPGSAILHVLPFGSTVDSVPMAKQKTDSVFDYYLAESWPASFPVEYWFEWRDGSESVYLSKAGTHDLAPDGASRFRLEYEQGMPSWAKGAFVYRLLPDRFNNATFSNDPEGAREDWYAPVEPHNASRSFGGDIAGMERKLEYLRTLGVDAILVEQVFGRDYSVERRFAQSSMGERASDRELADFISRARARGIKVILEASVPGRGAGDEEAILALAQEWGKRPLGSGLKAPSAVKGEGESFYLRFRDKVKSVNADAAILSPSGAPPSPAWDLRDDPRAFLSPVSAFLAGVDPLSQSGLPAASGDGLRFLEAIASVQAAMGQRSLLGAQLALESPGYARFATRAKALEETRKGAEEETSPDSRWLADLRLAVLLQMSLPGAPVLLYGGEAALEGSAGEDSLRGYPWGRENREIIAFYRDLASLRKTHSSLKTGSYRGLAASAEGLVSYLRWDQKSKLIVALNAGTESLAISLDAAAAGLQSGDRLKAVLSCSESGHAAAGPSFSVKYSKLSLSLPPRSGLLLLCPAPKEIPPSVEKRPRLKRVFPADKAKDLAPDTRVIMEFSEAMEQSSITKAFRIIPELPGSFVWNGNTCTFVPERPFERKTDYTVTLGKELRASSGGIALEEGALFGFSVE